MAQRRGAAMTPFTGAQVSRVFEAYPAPARRKLLALRELIFKTAAATAGVGVLQETLKWGEPAYVTALSKSGSTVRINLLRGSSAMPDQYALYFNCQTNLVETFRALFPKEFRFEGQRALLFRVDEALPRDALAWCIAAALTYHLQKKRLRNKELAPS